MFPHNDSTMMVTYATALMICAVDTGNCSEESDGAFVFEWDELKTGVTL